MSSEGAMADYSGDSLRSPIKRHVTNTSNPHESVHTLPVDDGECQSKGSYETARDIRVAELKKMFMLVQQAADTLSVLPLSPLLSCCFPSLTCFARMEMFACTCRSTLCWVLGYNARSRKLLQHQLQNREGSALFTLCFVLLKLI